MIKKYSYYDHKITNSLHCSHKIRVQECKGGRGIVTPMMSHDVIGMIEGVGWVWEGGVGMKNTQVYQFLPNPSHICVKIF